jgi:hypothetical protein
VNETPVKELMVPLSEYAVVNKDATLFDAVIELEKSQKEFRRSPYRHRAIIVLDENNEILGKISQMDVLRALEPKYREIGDTGEIPRSGFSLQFLKSMMNALDLWQKPLAKLANRLLQSGMLRHKIRHPLGIWLHPRSPVLCHQSSVLRHLTSVFCHPSSVF